MKIGTQFIAELIPIVVCILEMNVAAGSPFEISGTRSPGGASTRVKILARPVLDSRGSLREPTPCFLRRLDGIAFTLNVTLMCHCFGVCGEAVPIAVYGRPKLSSNGRDKESCRHRQLALRTA